MLDNALDDVPGDVLDEEKKGELFDEFCRVRP